MEIKPLDLETKDINTKQEKKLEELNKLLKRTITSRD